MLQPLEIQMASKINIGTWNLCLGLPNKKDNVTDTLRRNNIGICCLQETEIQTGFPENILNCNGFNLELEMNAIKKRVGIYIRKDLKYRRREDLEKIGMHIVIM